MRLHLLLATTAYWRGVNGEDDGLFSDTLSEGTDSVALAEVKIGDYAGAGNPPKNYFPNPKMPVALVTGKFGYHNMFKGEVDCAGAEVWLRKMNVEGAYKPEYLNCGTEFPDYILNDPSLERHLRFLKDPDDDSSRGGGYWFWKAVLANHTAHQLPDGAFLIYVDSDMRFGGDKWLQFAFRETLNRLVHYSMALAAKQQFWMERQWNKEDLFHFFNDDDAFSDLRWSGQFAGGIWAMRVDHMTRSMLAHHAKNVRKWHLINDEKSVRHPPKGFRANRHDQSLWSMMLKTAMVEECRAGGKLDLDPRKSAEWNMLMTCGKKLRDTSNKDNKSKRACKEKWDDCLIPKSHNPHSNHRPWNAYEFTYFKKRHRLAFLQKEYPLVWGDGITAEDED
jgi:hypothetical protein